MSDTENNTISNDENVVVEDQKKVSRKRKVELDEDGKPIKKVRMTNKVKYPNVKVQPRTAYQFFIMDKAKELRDDPDKGKLNTKELSSLWKTLDDRSKWEEMAVADKKRFYDEVRSHGYEIKEYKKKPSRPCSAFLLFARDKQKEYREQHGVTYPEALKALGERWNNPDFHDERVPYVEEANRLKEQWKTEQQQITTTDSD